MDRAADGLRKLCEFAAPLGMNVIVENHGGLSSKGDWLVDPSHGRLLAESAAPPVDYVHLDLPGSLHADALVKFVPLTLLRVLDRWFARWAPPQGEPASPEEV